MRTVSQMFADCLHNKDDAKALAHLKQYGIDQTGALNALALKGTVSAEWLQALTTHASTASPSHIGQALLLALAVPTDWKRREGFVTWMATRMDGEWHEKHNPIHHACFHGVSEAFDVLETEHARQTGRAFDWNTLNTSGHTPLYLALSQGHLETVVQVVRKGGSPTLLINNPKQPGQQISVLNLVFQNKSDVLSHMKEVWESAREKAALQNALEKSAVAPAVKKRNKKM